ncbi:zinc ribbon domain-containing protein [Candidatus Eisenbacteria bacterium]|uniref:Zinc ribbon domain-containing protein n=1 Tax=Eiseniibacteriota bacterium TaxID=2212470 RepID=A0ABV6YN35_UNCEI
MNSDFLLSGTMRCARCGHNLIGETIGSSKVQKDGTRRGAQYYVCAGYKNKGNSVCQRVAIRIEVIRLWLDGIDFDPRERRASVHMKRFSALSQVTGSSSFRLVAGAGFEPATFGL